MSQFLKLMNLTLILNIFLILTQVFLRTACTHSTNSASPVAFASLFASDLAFISGLSLHLAVEVQSLRMGLVLSPLKLFPLAAYLVLADRVWANY
jgi:hypothetical protein